MKITCEFSLILSNGKNKMFLPTHISESYTKQLQSWARLQGMSLLNYVNLDVKKRIHLIIKCRTKIKSNKFLDVLLNFI